jgi:hypothetical protein
MYVCVQCILITIVVVIIIIVIYIYTVCDIMVYYMYYNI